MSLIAPPSWPVRVLVFPAGTEVGLELHRSLSWSRHVELWGGSSTADTHARMVYQRCVFDLPWIDDEAFVPALRAVVEREQIDLLCAAHDSAVLAFATRRSAFGCRVVGSPAETAMVCRSKSRTYEVLRDHVRVPDVYKSAASADAWPVFLKPDVGQGSRGTYRADSAEQVRVFLSRDPSLLLLEYLPGREMTVDCFTDRMGVLRFTGARARIRIQNGISVNTRPEYEPLLDEMAHAINARLNLRGAWFFQTKENVRSEPVLMEVAPRIAGSMAVQRVRGVNLPLLSVYDALDMPIDIHTQSWPVEMDRALVNRYSIELDYDHVYVDLDDCIIRDDVVEPLVVALLSQFISRNKQIHLITRHAGTIDETLRRYRIDGLFDHVIHCAPGCPKSRFVTEASAIFIDDSFAERDEVSRKCGIPVFGLDAIECLFDWRR